MSRNPATYRGARKNAYRELKAMAADRRRAGQRTAMIPWEAVNEVYRNKLGMGPAPETKETK